MSLRAYLESSLHAAECDARMLHWRFELDHPELLADIRVPPSLGSWFHRLDAELNPLWRWIVFGPRGGGTWLHRDIAATDAWNALIAGEKVWIFMDPSASMADNVRSVTELDETSSTRDGTYWTTTQRAGDVVYVPSGWWHQVLYCEPCIAITENVLNEYCAAAVLEFLETRQLGGWPQIVRALVASRAPRVP